MPTRTAAPPRSARRRVGRARPPRNPPGLVLRVALWRLRALRPVLALAVVAVVVARVAAPPPPPSVDVVVLAGEVAAGDTLGRRDVRTARVPAALAPDAVLTDPAEAVGSAVLVDLPRGTPLVPGALARGRFGVEPPAGSVVVPLRLAGAAGLLRPGDHVDVVARDPDDAPDGAVLARSALVLALEAPGGDTGLLPTTTADGAVQVVVAVTPAEGRALAGRSEWSVLGAVLVG